MGGLVGQCWVSARLTRYQLPGSGVPLTVGDSPRVKKTISRLRGISSEMNKVLLLLSIALVGGCRRVRCSGSDKAVEDFPTARDHPPPLRVQHTHGHQSEEPQHFTKVAVQPAPHQ